MFIVKTTKYNLGVEISGSSQDLNELYDAISRLCAIPVKGYEGVENRIFAFLYDLRHTFLGHRDVCLKQIDQSVAGQNTSNAYEVTYANKFFWIDVLFVAFALEDYRTLCTEDPKHFIVSDPEMKKTAAYYRKMCMKDLALVSYFQECVWEALEQAIQEVRVKSCRRLLKQTRLNYRNYCPQALDFMNKRMIQAFCENRSKVLGSLVRNLIKKDAGYDELEMSIRKFAAENGIEYYEVDFEGNNMEPDDSIQW